MEADPDTFLNEKVSRCGIHVLIVEVVFLLAALSRSEGRAAQYSVSVMKCGQNNVLL